MRVLLQLVQCIRLGGIGGTYMPVSCTICIYIGIIDIPALLKVKTLNRKGKGRRAVSQ